MADDGSLEKLIEHFSSSCTKEIKAFGEALSERSASAVQSAITSVHGLKVTGMITDLVNSSKAAKAQFLEKLEDPGIRFLVGAVGSLTAFAAFGEATGIAAALSVSVLGVQIVAVVIIAIGLAMVFSALFEVATARLKSLREDVTNFSP